MKIHLDTDFGGDTDDACALALLLGRPDADLVAITTVLDRVGQRAGYVRHCLDLAGRHDVPIATGAAFSLTTQKVADPVVDDERHWPAGIAPLLTAAGSAIDLLSDSIDQSATIVGIGPYTNLALLETLRPGSLSRVPIVLMGGWTTAPEPGLPPWGPEMDFNVQYDTLAAQIVISAAENLTLVTLPATLNSHLRARDLPRLRRAGELGALLARQAEAHGEDYAMEALGRAHPGLPDDLLNFQYDPVASAVALGWTGGHSQDERLRTDVVDGLLRFSPDPDARAVRVVTHVDADDFSETWLTAIEAIPHWRK